MAFVFLIIVFFIDHYCARVGVSNKYCLLSFFHCFRSYHGVGGKRGEVMEKAHQTRYLGVVIALYSFLLTFSMLF